MKILVIGSNSFLAKEIKDYFHDRNFFYVDRKNINLENKQSVDSFFYNNYYDIVINTCTVGGKRGIVDNFDVLNSNLSMFNNLLNNRKNFNKLFLFCSGAAFDRTLNICDVKEDQIFYSNPKDYYGLSKNIIAREALKNENIYIFRIFGCFGKYELETRFIKNSLNRLKNNQDILIEKDKYMDYISSIDLCKILDYYIKNDNLEKDINVTYSEKIKLSEIGRKIINFKKSSQNVIIQARELDFSYTGSNSRLSSINLKLDGLDNSLRNLLCQI
jgi:dTDP-4-dehydrorhamnose reductase